jgi:catechol-2,3-dioxygenase
MSESIGTLYAFVLDVNDLDTCGRFWSQVLGAEVLYQDQKYVRLGRPGERLTLLLQKVPERRGDKNRAHIDLDVTDLDDAVSRVQALGGRQCDKSILWRISAPRAGAWGTAITDGQ